MNRPGLHEIYAASVPDGAAAVGFVLGTIGTRLAQGGARTGQPGEGPVCWIRQDWLGREIGWVHAPGLDAFAISPDRVALVCAKDATSLLQAGLEAARCPALSAVIIEFHGEARAYDLLASRRLTRAARDAGLPLYLVRHGATVSASMAETRWQVRSLPSRPLQANAPGQPAFQITLLRNRGGPIGQDWAMEWNRDRLCFDECRLGASEGGAASAAVSRAVVSLSGDRTGPDRRAG